MSIILEKIATRSRDLLNHTKAFLQIKPGSDRPSLLVADTLTRVEKLVANNQYEHANQLLTDSISSLWMNYGKNVDQGVLVDSLELSDRQARLSAEKRLADVDSYLTSIESYNRLRRVKPPRIAVFCAISGGYDSVKLPEQLDSRLDYILYTDTPSKDVGVYQFRPLPYIDNDPTRSARFVKTNPHKLLGDEYDFAVWVDANIMITGDIFPLIEKFILSKKAFGAFSHPIRSSPYEEMQACLLAGKDLEEAIIEQQELYRANNYDSNQLIESNFLMYNLSHQKLSGFLNDWWNHIDRYSKRDQLSINYCLDKNDVSWHRIFNRPNTARSSDVLALTHHGQALTALNEELLGRLPLRTKHKTPRTPRDSKSALPMIDVVYCVYNALEDVKRCLDSVVRYTLEDLNKFIIIDDGSNSDTREYLENFAQKHQSKVILKRKATPSGYTRAANRGLKTSSADLIILLNSDTIVTKNWIRKLSNLAFSAEDIGIVGPLSSAASHQSIPSHKNQQNQTAINNLPEGITPHKMNVLCERVYTKQAPSSPRVPLVHGFCFGIKRTVINKIGYFDEVGFERGYGEETDYCFRAANTGFGLAIATNTYIYHAKSKSYIGPEREQLMKRGMETLVNKHSRRRVTRAVLTMDNHPTLKVFREAAQKTYEEVGR